MSKHQTVQGSRTTLQEDLVMNTVNRTGHATESSSMVSGELLNSGASDGSQGNGPHLRERAVTEPILASIIELLQAMLQNTVQHLATDMCQRLLGTHCPELSGPLELPGFPSAGA